MKKFVSLLLLVQGLAAATAQAETRLSINIDLGRLFGIGDNRDHYSRGFNDCMDSYNCGDQYAAPMRYDDGRQFRVYHERGVRGSVAALPNTPCRSFTRVIVDDRGTPVARQPGVACMNRDGRWIDNPRNFGLNSFGPFQAQNDWNMRDWRAGNDRPLVIAPPRPPMYGQQQGPVFVDPRFQQQGPPMWRPPMQGGNVYVTPPPRPVAPPVMPNQGINTVRPGGPVVLPGQQGPTCGVAGRPPCAPQYQQQQRPFAARCGDVDPRRCPEVLPQGMR